MRTVKEVVAIALEYIQQLFPGSSSLRLEQVEHGGMGWQVVISFLPERAASSLAYAMNPEGARLYKEVIVNDDLGEATALKFWKP